MTAAHQLLLTNFAGAEHAAGHDLASDVLLRLDEDMDEFRTADLGPYAPLERSDRDARVADLDTSLIAQLVSGKSEPLADARGLLERVHVSRSDGTLQPYALYVPPNVRKNPDMVVLLHGRPQTESQLLGAPWFRRLAEASGTIVVAPYGRGLYDFAQPAADDVYETLDEVAMAYHVNLHRIYLAGYSMGGFALFSVGPLHAERWAGVMCVSGAILNSESTLVRWRFRDTPFYVVTGAKDDSIPTKYTMQTAAYLGSVGIPTSFYSEPTGSHALATLMPSLSRAWRDMLDARVRPETVSSATASPLFAAPTTRPDASLKS